jgi:hypothetical protein
MMRLGAYHLEKSTIIVEGTFRQGHAEYFAESSSKVRTCLNKHHAQVIRRQRISKSLDGCGNPSLFMVIDFASVALAE